MDLHFDDEGRLWVATFGGGLTRITKSTINKKMFLLLKIYYKDLMNIHYLIINY
ncbi:MAG: hypothetical protein IPI19_11035 [Ignavibacteriales bacterium]|nr:hypothetical protein [Ignavibacteriales bacterium]